MGIFNSGYFLPHKNKKPSSRKINHRNYRSSWRIQKNSCQQSWPSVYQNKIAEDHKNWWHLPSLLSISFFPLLSIWRESGSGNYCLAKLRAHSNQRERRYPCSSSQLVFLCESIRTNREWKKLWWLYLCGRFLFYDLPKYLPENVELPAQGAKSI